jgi:hypothetical protein
VASAFDRFVAVDWSGARGAYDGIAVAECGPGHKAPRLVPPPSRSWRRQDFCSWLERQAGTRGRMLLGIDCAFALPRAASEAMLGGPHDAPALWRHIDRHCADRIDFYGGDFAEAATHAPHFWSVGKRPPGFVEYHRATEVACRQAGHGAPESPLKLIGARQVGKGGLSGMRILSHLRQSLGQSFAVWPFDPPEPAGIVCVELYPRMFLRMAKHGNGKVRTLAELDRCLAALDSAPYGDGRTQFSDHEADALAAAAGLRLIAGHESVWNPPGLDALARRTEGWIFGV